MTVAKNSTAPAEGRENDPDIIETIRKSFKELSPQLRVVARYVIDYPHEFALNSLNAVSFKLKIPQSTIVRFAKHFGFSNGQDFQRTVSKVIIINSDYSSRIRLGQGESEPETENQGKPRRILDALIDKNIAAMRHMRDTLNNDKLRSVVDMMVEADTVFLIGVRRVFPVMLQMRYGLSRFHKKVSIIDGLGGMFREEAENIDEKSLVFAISFYPYSPEPIDVLKTAAEKQAKSVLITDSELHPVFDAVDESMIIRDAELYGLRTLSASMSLAQALVISVGAKINSGGKTRDTRPV